MTLEDESGTESLCELIDHRRAHLERKVLTTPARADSGVGRA